MTHDISVIIPAYARAATLPRAIESVRSQLGINAEIIVVDDGSPSPVPTGGFDPSVSVIRSDVNRGAGSARNLGVAHASHDALAFLDADDEWLPSSAGARLSLLGHGAFAVGAHRVINDLTGTSKFRPLPADLPAALRVGNPIHPSSLMISRADFELAGGFPEERDCAEDWVFFLRAIKSGLSVRSVQHAVALAHIDGSNTTSQAAISARHALGAVSRIKSESLLTGSELLQADRVVNARVAGFYANAARSSDCITHARLALRGAPDPVVLKELSRIPVQACRGALRRARHRRPL